jgi:GNAT superfamily N-acetyltransferase
VTRHARAGPGKHGSDSALARATVNSLRREPARPAGARLAAILNAAAVGQYPPSDGTVTILPQPCDRDAGVFSMTGCAVVFADTDPDWVIAQLPPGDLSAPLSAPFLAALARRLGRGAHSVDMVTCAPALPGPPPPDIPLAELTTSGAEPAHPRVARALRYRDEVRAWQTTGGVVLVGRGLTRRLEVAVEVDPEHRGRGLGTRLATAARHLLPAGTTLWAQIAPGNAASVRAFLRAGFRPVGAEALLSRE